MYATFDGSNSYYGSYAETALGVTKAPQATDGGGTEVQVMPDYTLAIVGVGIAMILAVAVATVLILRKR